MTWTESKLLFWLLTAYKLAQNEYAFIANSHEELSDRLFCYLK